MELDALLLESDVGLAWILFEEKITTLESKTFVSSLKKHRFFLVSTRPSVVIISPRGAVVSEKNGWS